MTENTKEPTYNIECHDIVETVEFCPFEWSSDLIAVATTSRISVGSCRFEEEAAEVDGVEFIPLRDFHHGARVFSLSWNPSTSLLTLPKILSFCTAGSDRKIRIFRSDLKNDDNMEILEGHTDYVNDVTFDPEKGEHIASVSDDHTCRIWAVEERSQKACFALGAPGMSVKWHSQDPMKVLVAEKRGTIRFYNVLSQQPIMSLECGPGSLLSADWCETNPLLVVAAAGGDWCCFDTSRSSRPLQSDTVHTHGCKQVKCSRSNEHLLVALGSSESSVKVINTKTGQVVVRHAQQIAEGCSWHHRLPLAAVGGDKKVNFWLVDAL